MYSPTNIFENQYLYMALCQNSIGKHHRKWLTARAVSFLWLAFPFKAGFYFCGLSKNGFFNRQQRIQIFRQFTFCVASVKFVQALTLFETLLLNYCSAGVTELYPIFIHCETKPYLYTFSNFTLSNYNTELYPILIHWAYLYAILLHYQVFSYFITLPNYTLS